MPRPRIVARAAGTARAPRRRLADDAYARLRAAIIQCELQPGARVTEAAMIRLSRVGKTPVRDALARLVQEKLIRSIPHHGFEVAPLTLNDVQQAFALRVILESAAVQLAAGHVDAERLRRLDKLCAAAARKPNKDHSMVDHLAANREFHVAIAEAAGNAYLTEDIARLLDVSERMFHLALQIRGDCQLHHHHRELLDALLAGDGETARRITVEKLLYGEREIINALIQSRSVRATQVVAEVVGAGR